MVDLLALAHDRGCEAELATVLASDLEASAHWYDRQRIETSKRAVEITKVERKAIAAAVGATKAFFRKGRISNWLASSGGPGIRGDGWVNRSMVG
ncbi:MAG: hypothetical protein H7267_03675 [Sandarakinorhabdus sp.]|nr:hypothetical protein [Sandarakinorhabdus sp.]